LRRKWVCSRLTSIVQDTALCPVLDYHGERSNTIVELDVGLDHTRVLDCGDVVHVDVAGELQLGVPDFYYPDFGCWYAYYTLHAVWEN
jgi:hypothetical protein